MSIDEIPTILQALERYSGKYEREAVDAAIAHREEITPILIDCLERVEDNPTQFREDLDYYLYVYGDMILGHLRETRAHSAIVKVFSLPDPPLYELFGDIVTENLPFILFNTCGGDFDLIRSMIHNRQADEFARGSAAQALAYAVAAGQLPREEVLAFLSTLFSGDEAEPLSLFWSLIADCILDLHPGELVPLINDADERGLLDAGFLCDEDLAHALDRSVAECLEDLRHDLQRRSLDDLHREMGSWDSFWEDEFEPYFPFPDKTKIKDEKAKKKSKKKQAKAARRKNRR